VGIIRSSRGQGVVEFAMVSPVLFLLLFGIMEGGWLLFHNHQVSNAAREGARYAVVNGEMSGTVATSESIRDEVIQRVSVSNLDSMTLELSLLDGGMQPESRIRVDVEYSHQTLTGFIFNGATIDLSSSSTMRVHY
jgi:Flp pilus assembly protein TadG